MDRLLYSSLWNALHQLCALGQQPSLVLCSKNTRSSSLHSGMFYTSSVEQALLYFEEQQLSTTLWCAAGPTTHSLDRETLDREGPIFMVMCHFWHRGTGWEIIICCFWTKGLQQSQGTKIFRYNQVLISVFHRYRPKLHAIFVKIPYLPLPIVQSFHEK